MCFDGRPTRSRFSSSILAAGSGRRGRRDLVHWKGLVDLRENDFDAAVCEAREELSLDVYRELMALGEYRQPSGKTVVASSVEADPLLNMETPRVRLSQWMAAEVRTAEELSRGRPCRLVLHENASDKVLKGQRSMLKAIHPHLR